MKRDQGGINTCTYNCFHTLSPYNSHTCARYSVWKYLTYITDTSQALLCSSYQKKTGPRESNKALSTPESAFMPRLTCLYMQFNAITQITRYTTHPPMQPSQLHDS